MNELSLNLSGEFDVAGKPKTSLAKYDLVVQMRLHTVLEAVGQTLHIKVCGKTRLRTNIFIILVQNNFSF